MQVREELGRARHVGEREELRALAKSEKETEMGGASCCGPAVFCSTMPNGVYMLLGNVTPTYIPSTVVRTGQASLPASNQPARTLARCAVRTSQRIHYIACGAPCGALCGVEVRHVGLLTGLRCCLFGLSPSFPGSNSGHRYPVAGMNNTFGSKRWRPKGCFCGSRG